MGYRIIQFKNGQLVNEAPESWIIRKGDKYYVWWPKSSIKVTYLIQNPEAEEPNANNFDCVEIETPDDKYYGKNNNLQNCYIIITFN